MDTQVGEGHNYPEQDNDKQLPMGSAIPLNLSPLICLWSISVDVLVCSLMLLLASKANLIVQALFCIWTQERFVEEKKKVS